MSKKLYTKKEVLEADVMRITQEYRNAPNKEVKKEKLDELKHIVTSMARYVNRQITTLKEKDVGYNVSLKRLEQSGGKLDAYIRPENGKVKLKSVQGLLKEYRRGKEFLESKFSTLAGIAEHKTNLTRAINDRLGVRWNKQTQSDFYQVYQRIMEQYPQLSNNFYDSDQIQEEIARWVDNNDTTALSDMEYMETFIRTKLMEEGYIPSLEPEDLDRYIEQFGTYSNYQYYKSLEQAGVSYEDIREIRKRNIEKRRGRLPGNN